MGFLYQVFTKQIKKLQPKYNERKQQRHTTNDSEYPMVNVVKLLDNDNLIMDELNKYVYFKKD